MKKRYPPFFRNRKRLRLKGYDYGQPGYYFITLCCNYRQRLFGKIENQKMVLNEPGLMINRWYYELENKFNHVICHEMIIMPDHMHFILEITDVCHSNDRRVEPACSTVIYPEIMCPNVMCSTVKLTGENMFSSGIFVKRGDTQVAPYVGDENNLKNRRVEPACSTVIVKFNSTNKKSLIDIMQWFKTMTTNEYIRGIKTLNWQPFEKKLWQISYYDTIFTKDQYRQIAEYILNNPKVSAD
jgi:REP element-mobilizing transposase RayT